MLYRFLHPYGRRLSLFRLLLLAYAVAFVVFHLLLVWRWWRG